MRPLRLIDALASAFINTFGITQPTQDQHRRAAWFIVATLILALGAVSLVGFALYMAISR